ncbi:TRAP-type mannitol/chloroaromatic compound transport system, small permease component [Paracoccus halophilus]|uniref:TRAP transporter small permease protein n=1 Tax=Paracoccus halophilus TaxID=376733 RepID=A0A099EX34_9RHOB|nr:TRAP transporter small permease subunit [Paracoccus halophilus]KGJ02531.1 C4-dicarboxylate ABC transporter permease [Paracoccus halophilus]SFA60796.1 TRAP-type mannitol/chloroaromatic compound transport system, small permease component [Paracoccus halophilus]
MISVIDWINEAVGRAVSLLAGVFAAIIIYDVFMRYVLNAPTLWGFDLTKMIYAFYFIMLGGYTLRHQAHVKVDLLTAVMSPGLRRWVEIAGYVIFFLPFSIVFALYSWQFGLRSLAQGEKTYGAVQMPVYPIKLAMGVAALLLLIQGISELLKLILHRTDHLAPMEPGDVR